MDLNMKQRWTEETLVVPAGLFLDSEPSDTHITTDGSVLEDLWTPAVYLRNSRSSGNMYIYLYTLITTAL